MPEELVGTVTHFFNGPSVAVVKLAAGSLALGDRIRFIGHTTDFTETIKSMEVEHQKVDKAGEGDEIAIQVVDRARTGDKVYKLS